MKNLLTIVIEKLILYSPNIINDFELRDKL